MFERKKKEKESKTTLNFKYNMKHLQQLGIIFVFLGEKKNK